MDAPSGPPGGGPLQHAASAAHTTDTTVTADAADAADTARDDGQAAGARVPHPRVPAVGSPAPELGLTDQHGRTVTLEEYRGAKGVLVVFYPYAFSRVCGSELAALHEAIDDFQNDRVQLLAVSCDAMFSLRAYADGAGFDFPLLADHWPHGAAARAYGVFDEARGCALRGSFLIDREGVIRWSVVNGLADARSLDDYRTAIAAAGL